MRVRYEVARTINAGPDTQFSMREEYSGVLAALIAKTIPDMNESFGHFADGLKAAAEASAG